mgnify:CR=1 FL=1
MICFSNSEIERWIDEDAPYVDLTSHLLGIGAQPAALTVRQIGRHFEKAVTILSRAKYMGEFLYFNAQCAGRQRVVKYIQLSA